MGKEGSRLPPMEVLVVSLLTDELVRRGHEVTLFASGDSISLAKLESIHSRALRLDPAVKEHPLYEMLQLYRVYEQATVYNGIDLTTHKFYIQPDNPPYLAFLGRISPEKGTHLAISFQA